MIDGVFNDRLHHQLDRLAAERFSVGADLARELVLKAHLLDGHIVAGVLKLLPYGDEGAAPREGDAEQPRQRGDHHDGVVIAVVFDHPDDRIEGVVEKMGVDLGLEHVQLGFAL